jgi:hypothetical protein
MEATVQNKASPSRATPMTSQIRELPRTELPPALVYVTGMCCGVLAATAVQILLGRSGIELVDLWRNILSAQALQIRSAGAWWLMVGSAFLVSAVVGAALSRLPLPWLRFRLLRWLLGTAIVFALAEAGHIASAVGGHGGGAHAAVTLATLGAASLVALFGAYFAIKR